MLGFSFGPNKATDALRKAIYSSHAVIEFDLSGRILDVSEKFCKIFGYVRDDLIGKHHSIFVDAEFAKSEEYRNFWARFQRGEGFETETHRIGKGGADVWSLGNYSPIFDSRGRIERIFAISTDVTVLKVKNADLEGKLKAILNAQAVVEFALYRRSPRRQRKLPARHGLHAWPRSKASITGCSSIPPTRLRRSIRTIWARIGRGESVVGVLHRNGKGGKRVLLQASYNPILDLKGRVVKVVKFAIDLSDLAELGKNLNKLAAGDVEHAIVKSVSDDVRADPPRFQQPRKRSYKTTMLAIAGRAEPSSP